MVSNSRILIETPLAEKMTRAQLQIHLTNSKLQPTQALPFCYSGASSPVKAVCILAPAPPTVDAWDLNHKTFFAIIDTNVQNKLDRIRLESILF